MQSRLLQLLNIRKDEAPLVLNLFWLQFLQGAGVAIFNTAAFAMFLEQFDVKVLPQVYIFAAVLLGLAGFVYSKVEHALPVKKLVPLVISFIALSIIALRLQGAFVDGKWFMFLMFSWYYVIYLLSNLEFWGLAALQFDIRQSKRLFGMIGAGDIPAKLLGYSAVPVLVPIIGNQNLLIVASVLILGALIFYVRLKRLGKLDIKIKHAHSPGTQVNPTEKATTTWREVLRGFFGNRMIAMVAALSFIVVTSVTIISFSFYAEIKHEAHNDVQLASFIALFYAGGRALAIVVRLIFTGRITAILGTRGTLLVSPILLFLFLVVIITLPFFTGDKHPILYIFGLMAIVTEVLKTSLQDPVFLSLMQPLSSHLRLKGHTVVKGIMDPFALAFSGFMLFSIIEISRHVDLFLLSYMLFTLLVVWVILIFLVDREYLHTLVRALDKRYSVGQEIDLASERTREILLAKTASGERGEAIYILGMVEKQMSPALEPVVLQAIQHPAIEVRMEAIKLAERKKILSALPVIDGIVHDKKDQLLLPEAVKAKCMLHPDELQNFDELLSNSDSRLTRAAVTGLMASGGISAVVTAGQKLLQLIASPVAGDRKMAAEIIGELGISSFYKPLFGLMADGDAEVAKAAITAAGKVKNEKLIAPLLQFFLKQKHEKQVIDALHISGMVAITGLRNAFFNETLNRRQYAKLILVLGRIGSQDATLLLDELVWHLPHMRTEIFHALHLCQFKSQPQNRQKHIDLMNHYLASATRILFMVKELQKTKSARVLADALNLELNEIRDSLLLLFSFVYDREQMLKAKNAFHLNRKENVANAFEVIEIQLPKEISARFTRLFEWHTLEERCNAMRTYFKEELSYEKIVDEILQDVHHTYHRWTKAAALHSVIFYKGHYKKAWLQKASGENDILLSQTADRILAETV